MITLKSTFASWRLGAVILGSAALATAWACRSPTNVASVREVVAEAPPLTFAQLRGIIDTQKPRSVEELIALLPEDFRSRPVLMSDSRSTQEANALAPRVILANRDLSLTFAFNGDPAQSGYAQIETIEFDAKSGTYTFREIKFPDGDEAGDPEISKDNPKACLTCHRNPGRLSWEPWPSWPEAYFGRDRRADNTVVPEDEVANFKAFLAGPAKKGRYRYLRGLERYSDPEALRRGEPANGFNRVVQDQIAIMVMSEILRHPAYQRLKWAFAGAVNGCDDIPSFIPAAERETFTEAITSLRKETLLKNAKAGPKVVALRYLFENYKLPTGHWSPSLRTRWAFRRGPDQPDDLDLAKVFAERSGLGEMGDCATLKAKSLGQAASSSP